MNPKPELLSNPWADTHRNALATVARCSGLDLRRVIAVLGNRCSSRRYREFTQGLFRRAA